MPRCSLSIILCILRARYLKTENSVSSDTGKSHFINFHSRYLGEMFVEGEDPEVMLKADGSNENI